MSKLIFILLLALCILIGVALCYYVLKIDVVVTTVNSIRDSIKPDSTTLSLASIGGIGGIAGIAGLALNAASKAKTQLSNTAQKLGESTTAIQNLTNQTKTLTDTKTNLETQINQLKTDASTQVASIQTQLGDKEKQIASLTAQNQQLSQMLEARPIQILEKTVVK